MHMYELGGVVQRRVIGNFKISLLKVLLKLDAISRVSSRCWAWSSPTGT